MEELQQLWEGVTTYDVLKPMGLRTFILKGILLWTIHDFLGCGCVVGMAHQGYATCAICGPEFRGEHSIELGKQTYATTRQWLLERDPYKLAKMANHFNGKLEIENKICLVTTL